MKITKEMIENRFVQGDVVLMRVDALPPNAQQQEFEKKVLQMSEVTGHHHHFRPTAKVDLYVDQESASSDKSITPNLGKYVVVTEDSVLYHGKEFTDQPAKVGQGDHNSQLIPAGIYYVNITSEFDYDRMESVAVRD